MLLVLLSVSLLASTPPPPKASCLSVNGRTACGYACRASTTEVRCASTPYGVCGMFGGEVHCFDPLPASIHHPPDEGLVPECKAVRGEVACGFNCLVSQGRVACAKTPYGVCREHFHELTCWDPPEATLHEFGRELPRPTCQTASTAIACGYDCKVNPAEVRCAQTPRGRCVKDAFTLECYDPPPLVQCAHSELPSPEEVRKPRWKRQETREQAQRPGEGARQEPPRR
jgi:hypothetical protein